LLGRHALTSFFLWYDGVVLHCLLIAAVLGVLNAILAAAAWNFVRNVPQRPLKVRLLAAGLGAAGGSALAMPQVYVALDLLGFEGEGAGIMAAFTFPMVLPLVSGIAAWLFAEMLGGRSARPARALAFSTGAAFVAALVSLVPLLFLPTKLPRAPGYALVFGLIIAASVLGVRHEAKRCTPR
jgi:hypothetical protein